jgi:hypothetical protein
MSPIPVIVFIVFYPCTPVSNNGLKRRQVIIIINIVIIGCPSAIIIVVHRLQVGHHFYLVYGTIALIR